jgi:hypothetical protein
MADGYMDSTLHGQQTRERSLAYQRATDAAEARALTKRRIAILEAGIRNAINTAPDVFAGLDAHGAATLVVQTWES